MFVIINLALNQSLRFIRKDVSDLLFFQGEEKVLLAKGSKIASVKTKGFS